MIYGTHNVRNLWNCLPGKECMVVSEPVRIRTGYQPNTRHSYSSFYQLHLQKSVDHSINRSFSYPGYTTASSPALGPNQLVYSTGIGDYSYGNKAAGSWSWPPTSQYSNQAKNSQHYNFIPLHAFTARYLSTCTISPSILQLTFHTAHLPYNNLTYRHFPPLTRCTMFIFIIQCCYMFRPQDMAMFRELQALVGVHSIFNSWCILAIPKRRII